MEEEFFKTKQESYQDSFRYGNVKALLSELKELSYFNTDSSQPSKWENGVNELAKLSDEELANFKDTLTIMGKVILSIEYFTETTTPTVAFKRLIEIIEQKRNKS